MSPRSVGVACILLPAPVAMADTCGTAGFNGGPQMHFEVLVGGKHLDPAPIVGGTQP
jgi:hypothetical protein